MSQSYPNQKKITISKQPCNDQNLYARINMAALTNAMQMLNGADFKLWIYLTKNTDNHSFWLSAVDAAKYGLPSSTYHKSVASLISQGYLIQTADNQFQFHELPQKT